MKSEDLLSIRTLFDYFIESTAQNASNDRILIGGQALFAYVSVYFDKLDLSSQEKVDIQSKDVDFSSKFQVASDDYDLFIKHLYNDFPDEVPFLRGITLSKPKFDDPTPNSGIIKIENPDDENDPLLIDYLSHIKGVTDNQLKNNKATIEYKGIALNILSPLNLLRSRVANYFELGYGEEKKDRERVRLSVVAKILGAYSKGAIKDGAAKAARNLIQEVYKEALNPKHINLYHQINFDPIEHLPINDPALGVDFLTKNLPRLEARLQGKRGIATAKLPSP